MDFPRKPANQRQAARGITIAACFVKTFMYSNTKKLLGYTLLGAVTVALIQSCKTIPEGAVPVQSFDVKKYLGKWYEIARFDSRFEKDLKNVTAQYSFNSDSSIKVVNRGYDIKKNSWKEATGKAKFRESKEVGKLKVSFFGPFYAGYNVIAVDANYQYALVAGKNLKYLWLLSRNKTMPRDVRESFLEKAKQAGYNTSSLVWVEQD